VRFATHGGMRYYNMLLLHSFPAGSLASCRKQPLLTLHLEYLCKRSKTLDTLRVCMPFTDAQRLLSDYKSQNGKTVDEPGEIGAWCFTVIEADERRIISAKAEPVLPSLAIASQDSETLGSEALTTSEQSP
jgi:hypothetical protein